MAELRDILEKNDFSVHMYSSQSFGTNASRIEIEDTLRENGYNVPLANSVSFTITDDNDKSFVVSFVQETNSYLVIKPKVV